MFFRQIFEEGLAQSSYLVGCPDSGEALVVDPRRDVDVFLRAAEENDLRIIAVTETHIHADFLSGGRELAHTAGATLCVSAEGGTDWQYHGLPENHTRLHDGDVIEIGNVVVRAVHTPGHTPEHMMFVVSEGATARGPMMALTGDFVFVGDIGRPDLLEAAVGVAGSAVDGARTMFASLRDKLSQLPDYVQIWPAHGAGSACGKALGAVPASTVGYERLSAWWAPLVASGDEERFVRELLDGQPDAPTYFARMKRLNRDGAPVLRAIPRPEQFDATRLRAALGSGASVVDARERAAFRAGHIVNALSIPDEPTFSTRSAWFVPADKPIVLIARPERVDALVRAFIRVGLDEIVGYVASADATADGAAAGARLELADIAAARADWERGSAVILDVRSSLEYREGHIPGAIHVPAGQLLGALSRIPHDKPVLVHCASGSRSGAAASALLAHGFDRVKDVAGGFPAWEQAGNPVEAGDKLPVS